MLIVEKAAQKDNIDSHRNDNICGKRKHEKTKEDNIYIIYNKGNAKRIQLGNCTFTIYVFDSG